MKRYVFMAVSVLVAALGFLGHAKLAPAQEPSCPEFWVTPESGDYNTRFTFRAECNFSGRANLVILDKDGGSTTLSRFINLPFSGSLEVYLLADRSTPEGTYYAHIVRGLNALAGPIEFSINESETSYKVCCSITSDMPGFDSAVSDIIQNEPNCIVPSNSLLCPSICQSLRVIHGGQDYWLCAAARTGHPSLCERRGLIGIDSAIGCIPFEDTSLTTAFFLRWGLGLGGGIALFMVSLGAIKLMTVRDDPKRAQDARDSMTAGVVGLVLLILAVFIARFISESLLQLL